MEKPSSPGGMSVPDGGRSGTSDGPPSEDPSCSSLNPERGSNSSNGARRMY